MARMIDPSQLEGDELLSWYRRTPDEVEADREADRQAQYEAFVKSIGAPSGAQETTVGGSQDSGTTQSSSDGLRSGDVGLIKAKYFEPPLPVVTAPPEVDPNSEPMMEPSGHRVGPTIDARGGPAIGGAAKGFFASYPFLGGMLGGYYTNLPLPLNTVVPKVGGKWFELGDTDLVSRDEVERIYAEQQRRLKGQDKPEPAANVQAVDKLPSGQVPRADQLAKDERELDPTCHPYGGWERDSGFARYSKRTQQYETQITHAPGLDYVVRIPGKRAVKFDGCAVWDPRHPLLEAKGPGYAPLLPKAIEWGFYGNMWRSAVDQADRQAAAAPNKRIEWHVAEPGARRFFEGATVAERPPIVVKQTPAR